MRTNVNYCPFNCAEGATFVPKIVAILGAVFALFSGLSYAHADEEEEACEVEVVKGGVACLDEEGSSSWQIHHPKLWDDVDDYLEGAEPGVEPVGPASFDESTFYAVGLHLFELDPVEGVIERRTRFPATIVDVEPGEEHLGVTVEDNDRDLPSDDGPFRVTFPYAPGDPPPAQYEWSSKRAGAFLLAEHDARWLAESAEDDQEAIELLERARERDPTNPFLSITQGKLLEGQGDEEGADRAFEEAANTSNGDWRDLLSASSALEVIGAHEEAERAFRRGFEQMQRAGVSEDRLTSRLSMATVMMNLVGQDSPIAEAVVETDPARVDHLSERFATVFPYVEDGCYAWRTLAGWMDAQDEPKLADKWQSFADENDEYGGSAFYQAVIGVDFGVLALVTAIAALFLLVLIIGVRGGVERVRSADFGSKGAAPSWLPVVRGRDLVVPCAAFVVVLVVPFYIGMHLEAVDTMSSAPAPMAQDGLAAPHGIAWLEDLAESEPRDRLLERARAELEALEEGEALPEKEPVIHLVYDAIYADAKQEQFEKLATARAPNIYEITRTFGSDGSVSSSSSHKHALLLAFGLLLVVLFVLIVGSMVGARVPDLAKKVLRYVPGGADRFAPLGAIVLVVLVAALASFVGLDRLMWQISEAGSLPFFGLQGIEEFAPEPARRWRWVALAVAATYEAFLIGKS